jgi:hypothetical protein
MQHDMHAKIQGDTTTVIREVALLYTIVPACHGAHHVRLLPPLHAMIPFRGTRVRKALRVDSRYPIQVRDQEINNNPGNSLNIVRERSGR